LKALGEKNPRSKELYEKLIPKTRPEKEVVDLILTFFEEIDDQIRLLIEKLIGNDIANIKEIDSQHLIAHLGSFKIRVNRLKGNKFEFSIYIKECFLDVFRIRANDFFVYYPSFVRATTYKRMELKEKIPIIDAKYNEDKNKITFYFRKGILKQKLPPIYSDYGVIEFVM